jgi:iron(III) transport system substrate-binding protein
VRSLAPAFAACFFVLAGPTSAEELHVYTAIDRMEVQEHLRTFEKQTGIRVRWVRLSTGEVLTRVRAERRNPQASVWFGGPSFDFITAASEGLFEAYRPTTYDRFAPETRDPEWRWCGAYLGYVAFASNPNLLARRGAKLPTSWSDLLRPELKGDVSLAYAYTSGTAYTVVASLVQLFGEEKGIDYLKQLDGQVHHYNRSGTACVTQVGLGEVATCVAFSQDILSKGVGKGYPVVLTFPSEGTGYEVGGIALLHGAPEPAAAKRLIDWVFTRETQERFAQWNRLPVRDDVSALPGSTGNARRIAFDPQRAAADRRRLVDAWREVTGQ